MKTIQKLNLATTILYTLRTVVAFIGIVVLLFAMNSSEVLMHQGTDNLNTINRDSVTAGYEVLGSLGVSFLGLSAILFLGVLLIIIGIEAAYTLIATITNLILTIKYRKTMDVKKLKIQTYFNFIYTSVSLVLLVLIAIGESGMLCFGIPVIVTEIIAVISFIKFLKVNKEA